MDTEKTLIAHLSSLSGCLYKKTEKLEHDLLGTKNCTDVKAEADYFKDTILPSMQEARAVADELELICGERYWPFPTYGDLLYRI